MPGGVAIQLAHNYRRQMERFEEHFGGYASFWRFCAERLVAEPPAEEHLPYPLWNSHLWEEWTRSPEADVRRPRFQSGPLSSTELTRRGE